MAEGFSVATANALEAAMFQGVSFVWSEVWVQLHVGAPGVAGTSNVAAESTRVNATGCFGTDPVSGEIANDAVIGPWASVVASEDYTHVTLWSASSGGTFGLSGLMTPDKPATVGDNFQIEIGHITFVLPTAS